MGSGNSVPNYNATVRLSNGEKFKISYEALIDHVILLGMVISCPELTKKSPLLLSSIRDYCQRMSTVNMNKKSYQAQLPLEIEWIWHVHRLHPIDYYEDCINGSYDGQLIDKKVTRTSRERYPPAKPDEMTNTPPLYNPRTFKPSIDLVKAVLRQRDFLEKFQKHAFSSLDTVILADFAFRRVVQDYALFLKLVTEENRFLVPTYDIDIIWHTHMRYPVKYRYDTITLIGFTLNHNDSLPKKFLESEYNKMAERWKSKYGCNYGETVDRDHLKKTFRSSCAMVAGVRPSPILTFLMKYCLTNDDAGSCSGCASCSSD